MPASFLTTYTQLKEEGTMSTLQKAIEIATKAHAGDEESNGKPYILHPLRIMFHVDSLEEKIVAVLHDVVEYTDVTLDDLQAAGFPDAVLEAMRLVTRTDGEDYDEYIEKIKNNSIARDVKLTAMKQEATAHREVDE